MNRLQRHPLLAALFALALLAGGVGAVQAQQADPAPPDATACPMMQSESGGMMGMMSTMKDCPMMAERTKKCPMMRGMMDGQMEPDSTMQGRMHRGTNRPATPAQTGGTARS